MGFDMYALSDYDYDLPSERIAQRPCEKRSESKYVLLFLVFYCIFLSPLTQKEHYQLKTLNDIPLHSFLKTYYIPPSFLITSIIVIVFFTIHPS